MTAYFLTFALLCTVFSIVNYLQGSTSRFMINIVCAAVNLIEFFFWS